MSKKIPTKRYLPTTEEFIEILTKESYKFISGEILKSKSFFVIECPEHHRYRTTWNAWQQNRRCQKCAGTKRGKNRRTDIIIGNIPHKKCSECKKFKPYIEFNKLSNTWNGLQRRCKDCSSLVINDHNSKNKNKRKEVLLKSRLKRKYKTTIDEFKKMYYTQNNTCSICKLVFDDIYDSRVCVDHDHRTGKIRGLLCNKCNSAIGFLNEDVETLNRAIEYLKRSNYE